MKTLHKPAVALTCIFLLASCGGGSGGGSTPTPPPVAVTPPPPPPPPPTPTPPPPPPPVASKLTQADARIGACINMSNQLEGNPTEGSWGRAIVEDDFAQIKARGFETIRLPVRWSTHAMATAPYTIDAAWMTRVETVVNQARAAGLRVILDVHHYDEIFSNPDAHKDRFAAFWLQIADRFKNADDKVWFELLNEPHDRITSANLLSILNPALANIRLTNPTRPVVIGGENYSNVYTLDSLPLPNDAYIIATFHYYDPFNFTHQGATFLGAGAPPVGRVFGSAGDIGEIDANVTRVRNFQTRTGVPVFLGEYGAYQDISQPQRELYYKTVADKYRSVNVDGCVWGYTSSFNFRQDNATTGTWNAGLLRAIGLTGN